MQRERRKNNDILFHFRKDGLPMTKLSQLKIDPEFQNQINPPSFEKTHQLEMNILKEERVLNPIITWNGYRVAPLGRCGHRQEFPCRVHCKLSDGAGSACAYDELCPNPERAEPQLFRAK